ncbi:MAG: mechanosensitive ion channel, partial [Armatimonadetes bacterium]|nr:mechanosensitive ion channel [Armatimonadota bacterium]
MEFLKSLGDAMGPHLGLVGLGALLLGGVLMVAVPDRRRGLVASVVVTLICLVLTGVDSLLGHVGGGALFRGFATYGVGAALITILCVGAFHVLLPALRVSTTGITRDVSALVAHVAWVFISLRRNGVELTSLVTTSAVLTAVIGFSLQDTLGNVLGGLFLQIDRSVQVGDWILLDDVNGQVVEIRWRYTAVQTRNWETVIIPNSVLLKNRFRVAGRRVGAPQ